MPLFFLFLLLPTLQGRDPDNSAATPSRTWQHVRFDEGGVAKAGDGSFAEGMNRLGKMGYRLFHVTSAGDTGRAGYHFFKRPPWNKPMPRPQYEYKRLDDAEVATLGNDNFDDGLTKLEKEGWELLTVTSTKGGGVGFYYFVRSWEGK